MKLSIFTPTHDPKHLVEVYASIKDQSFDEWVILYNNGAKPVGFTDDPRVKEIVFDLPGSSIGRFKKLACANCTGDVLLELDHDDFLTPDAIAEVREAFEDPEVGFVYSNALYTNLELGRVPRFGAEFGWQYRETLYEGHLLDEPLTFDLTPSSVSRIWFAPDHLRAFRKSVYEQVGGHDESLEVLDDQDLMCRMYQVTKFHHIDKGLYVYRVHGGNCWIQRNQKIQEGVYPMYDKYIEPLALKWATDQWLRKLDLGGRINGKSGFETVDRKDADVIVDLNDEWPFPDGSVGVVRAFDVIEHLKDPLHTMKELYRVLAPGGYAFIQVPSTDGRGAFQDPTHVSFYNENCVAPDTMVLCADMKWRPAGELMLGDKIVGFDENPIERTHPAKGRPRTSRHFRTATVEGNTRLQRKCLRIETDCGIPVDASEGHPWLIARQNGRYKSLVWVVTSELNVGDRLVHFGNPWETELTWESGWLAGMFDGEGCLSFSDTSNTRSRCGKNMSLMVSQRQSSTLERIKESLAGRGFAFRAAITKGIGGKECVSLCINGGRYEKLRFVGSIRPPRFVERDLSEYYEDVHVKLGSTVKEATVTKIEVLGDREVCGLQTSTGTLITNGYLSHNSFLYYTDESWSRYIDTPVRFQAIRLYTTEKDQQGVCWTIAHLLKLSGDTRVPGRVSI